MIEVATQEAGAQGVTRSRGVVRAGNRPSKRAFGRAGLSSKTQRREQLIYVPQGIYPIPYLPTHWRDALASGTPPRSEDYGGAPMREVFFTHSYTPRGERGKTRARAGVVLVYTRGGSALWIERPRTTSPDAMP